MINTYNTRLLTRHDLTPNITLFHFKLENNELIFAAGQYLILFVPSQGDYLRRLFSIATPPAYKKEFDLLVEILPNGAASYYLKNAKLGENIMFQGPAGLFTLKSNAVDKTFLVTGTGIAPIKSMLYHHLPTSSQKYTLFWGLRQFSDVYFFEELKSLSQKYDNFQFKICLSREENLDKINPEDKEHFALGRVNEVWQKTGLVDYYLCGNRDVVESLRQFLLVKGINRDNIIFEKF